MVDWICPAGRKLIGVGSFKTEVRPFCADETVALGSAGSTYKEAMTYCQSHRGTLPTTDQLEKIYRGPDGNWAPVCPNNYFDYVKNPKDGSGTTEVERSVLYEDSKLAEWVDEHNSPAFYKDTVCTTEGNILSRCLSGEICGAFKIGFFGAFRQWREGIHPFFEKKRHGSFSGYYASETVEIGDGSDVRFKNIGFRCVSGLEHPSSQNEQNPITKFLSDLFAFIKSYL